MHFQENPRKISENCMFLQKIALVILPNSDRKYLKIWERKEIPITKSYEWNKLQELFQIYNQILEQLTLAM